MMKSIQTKLNYEDIRRKREELNKIYIRTNDYYETMIELKETENKVNKRKLCFDKEYSIFNAEQGIIMEQTDQSSLVLTKMSEKINELITKINNVGGTKIRIQTENQKKFDEQHNKLKTLNAYNEKICMDIEAIKNAIRNKSEIYEKEIAESLKELKERKKEL